MRYTRSGSVAAALVLFAAAASGQSTTPVRYPAPPAQLPEEEEIALAVSAAPPEVSSRADVYVLRGTDYVKVRTGTNGAACLVGREPHAESRYPICYDQEGVRSLMLEEMKIVSLTARGMSHSDARKAVDAALADGSIPRPSKVAVTYMMSPKQVIYSSPGPEGRRVGQWYPHLMIGGAHMTREQLGFPANSRYVPIQAGGHGTHNFVILLPVWSDGTAAPTPPSGR